MAVVERRQASRTGWPPQAEEPGVVGMEAVLVGEVVVRAYVKGKRRMGRREVCIFVSVFCLRGGCCFEIE